MLCEQLTRYNGGEGHSIVLNGLDLMDVLRPSLRDEAEPLWTRRELSTEQQGKLTSTLRGEERRGEGEKERERKRANERSHACACIQEIHIFQIALATLKDIYSVVPRRNWLAKQDDKDGYSMTTSTLLARTERQDASMGIK